MDEKQYQIDFLRAINQKISADEKMYHVMCDTADSALLYHSMADGSLHTAGRFKEFFDFEMHDMRDFSHIFEMLTEEDCTKLSETLYPEKYGRDVSIFVCMTKDRKKWYRFRVNVVVDEYGKPTDKIIRITDVTKFRRQTEELEYFAYYDSMTGLYNRNYFIRRLDELLRRAKEEQEIVCVLMFDIDDFRKINDTLGMIVGDEVVQQMGMFLKSMESEQIIVCHYASDEYCMGIYSPSTSSSVMAIYDKVAERLKRPFTLSNGLEVSLTVSVGEAEYPEAADSAIELINNAEIAMFKCKASGKNAIRFYTQGILNEFVHTVEIENKLKDAVACNNFLIYYQPQYYVGNKKLRGMEALIRMPDMDKTLISPGEFIPIAEKNGTIIPIGAWVIEESISQFAKWKAEIGMSLILSLNISARQFEKENFVDFLLEVLDKYKISYQEVELEVTESILIEDFSTVCEKLRILREKGVRISLDDFGTGFSSLSYLKKLPIDTLKIDKSFIDTVLTDSTSRVIMESIIELVKALGFESIAEGVEDERQFQYLHSIGCDVIQGYLLGKPLPTEEMEDLIRKIV